MIPPLARRFVAGETAAEAIAHAEDLHDHDVGAIFNLLGEHYGERAPAEEDARTYCKLVSDVAATDARACISVKPTQLGLGVSEECFRENLDTVVGAASEHGVFVWIDMEDHPTTDATLDAFEHHARAYRHVGVCVQANLERTREDLDRLAPLPGKVRLVKGAYNPPPAIGYTDKEQVDRRTADLLGHMFETFDDGIALGSHDPALITRAADLHEQYGTPYELQMLMGVRPGAQFDLAAHHDVWQYVPYGNRWLSYFYRRMTERTENITFALRALNPF